MHKECCPPARKLAVEGFVRSIPQHDSDVADGERKPRKQIHVHGNTLSVLGAHTIFPQVLRLCSTVSKANNSVPSRQPPARSKFTSPCQHLHAQPGERQPLRRLRIPGHHQSLAFCLCSQHPPLCLPSISASAPVGMLYSKRICLPCSILSVLQFPRHRMRHSDSALGFAILNAQRAQSRPHDVVWRICVLLVECKRTHRFMRPSQIPVLLTPLPTKKLLLLHSLLYGHPQALLKSLPILY